MPNPAEQLPTEKCSTYAPFSSHLGKENSGAQAPPSPRSSHPPSHLRKRISKITPIISHKLRGITPPRQDLLILPIQIKMLLFHSSQHLKTQPATLLGLFLQHAKVVVEVVRTLFRFEDPDGKGPMSSKRPRQWMQRW
jgi:hypothetical protein